MALTFTKQNNGNIIVFEGAEIVKCLQPTLNVLCDPQKPEVLILSATPNPYDEAAEFKFKFSEVTTPAYTDKEDLITQLCTDYFDGQNATRFDPFAVGIHDTQTASRAIVDLNGALKTGEAIILTGDKFTGATLNPGQWLTDGVGTGAVSGIPGSQRLSTGTTANSEIRLQSVRPARFMISQFNIAHFGNQFNPAILADPNTVIRFGVFDPIDPSGSGANASRNGSFMEYSNLTWFIVAIKNGVETHREEAADWNGVSVGAFNPAPDLSVYEMQYNAGTLFYFQGPNFIHRVSTSETYAATYDFPVGFEVLNVNGNTTDHNFDTRAGGIYRLGEERGETTPVTFTGSALIKGGAGYITAASLSRTGSSGGSGSLELYDGLDATGRLIARVDVGGDDIKPVPISGSFYTGLYGVITGSGTNTANVSYE